ncbi:MAG: NYN domain-containing protein [Candidatus Latescibacterota bacterium]|nr:MAG: NYN domain-containing protein [Candidatus Latescibacterota bacterium]
MPEVSSLAVFVDFENLALGFQDRKDRFDIQRVLQRLVEKGKIIVKKAYADWSRYSDYKRALHESGLELIEIPLRAMTGKNSADIRLVVDAMDLCYSKEHIDTFVIVSGDSDFSPLVAKLKENGKRVLGLAMRNSTSELLVSACDEFIFYENLEDVATESAELEEIPSSKQKVFRLLLETLTALQREISGPILASMIKDTIRRKQPSFNESGYGYRSFSELLEDAQRAGILRLSTDARSGTYHVTEFQATTARSSRRSARRRSSAEEGDATATRSASGTGTRKSSSTPSSRRRKPRKSETSSENPAPRKRPRRKTSASPRLS